MENLALVWAACCGFALVAGFSSRKESAIGYTESWKRLWVGGVVVDGGELEIWQTLG